METIIDHHPSVDIIWNFFPLSLLVWNPIRAALNFIFMVFYVPALPIITIWNLFPEGFCMITINTLLLLLMGGIVYVAKIYAVTTVTFWWFYGVLAGIDLLLFTLPSNLIIQPINIAITASWGSWIVLNLPVTAYDIDGISEAPAS